MDSLKVMDKAYDEFDPVAAFKGDVGCYISTSFVALRDAKRHGDIIMQ